MFKLRVRKIFQNQGEDKRQEREELGDCDYRAASKGLKYSTVLTSYNIDTII